MSRLIDVDLLRALARKPVKLDLSGEKAARGSAEALGSLLAEQEVHVTAKLDEKTKDVTDNKLGIKIDTVTVNDDSVVLNLSTQNADIPTGSSNPCFENL